MENKNNFIEGEHFYLESGKVIFTEAYHIQRGECCGSGKTGCRHCPYTKPVKKGNTKLDVPKK